MGWVVLTACAGVGVVVGWLVARGRHGGELHGLRASVERLRLERDRLAGAERQAEQRQAQAVRAETEAQLLRTRVVELEGERQRWHETGKALAALEARWAECVDALADRDALELELETARRELARSEASLEAERLRAMEHERELERFRELTRQEVQGNAQQLIDTQGRAMADDNQRAVAQLLEPMRERLLGLEQHLQQLSDRDGRDRAALLERLGMLAETQSRLHADAQALARALHGDTRAQGDWGELVLERLLDAAGLTEGREYELQIEHRDEEGHRKRPDAVIRLPGDKVVIVDAKCSLQAFVASTRAADEDEREADLDAHVSSVRAHVRLLAQKDYQHVVDGRSLDVVLLFVPNEAALHAALGRDPTLFEDAFRQRVVLCGPATLLATLQVVSHVWRSERQTLNAQRIAEEAGKMIDKLSGALEAFDELGDRLARAQTAFDQARSRLSTGRNSVSQIASRVVELGAPQNRTRRLESVQGRLGFSEADEALPAVHEKEGDW